MNGWIIGMGPVLLVTRNYVHTLWDGRIYLVWCIWERDGELVFGSFDTSVFALCLLLLLSTWSLLDGWMYMRINHYYLHVKVLWIFSTRFLLFFGHDVVRSGLLLLIKE